MFDQLFERPHALARQLSAPLVEERREYLSLCHAQEFSRSSLRFTAQLLVATAEYLKLDDRPSAIITPQEIEEAGPAGPSAYRCYPLRIHGYRASDSFIAQSDGWPSSADWKFRQRQASPTILSSLSSCGTSEASPLFAGIVAIADQAAGKRLGLLNDRLYRLSGHADSGLVDVTSGDNSYTFCASACGTAAEVDTTVPGFSAGPGYDMASGLGTIDATRLVAALTADGH